MDRKSGILFALLAALVSGFSVFLNKFAVGQADAVMFTLAKNLFAVLAIAAVSMNLGEIRRAFKSSPLAILYLSVFGGGIAFILFFLGLKATSAVSANFFHKSMFLLVPVVSFVLLRKAPSKKQVGLGALLLLGNALFWKVSGLSLNSGDVLILLATAIWAGEAVVAGELLRSASASAIATIRLAGGLPVILGYLLFRGADFAVLFSLPSLAWSAGLGGVLALYVTFYFSALRNLGAFEAVSILSLAPAITLALSLVPFTPFQLAGTAVLSAGIGALLLSSRWEKSSAA